MKEKQILDNIPVLGTKEDSTGYLEEYASSREYSLSVHVCPCKL